MNISSFINLCKPKIVILLTITALVGMLLSIEFYSNISSSLLSLIGFAFLAASSAALNQIFDRESDKNMDRTKKKNKRYLALPICKYDYGSSVDGW